MTLEIKILSTYDGYPIQEFTPESAEDFSILLFLRVGLIGQEGGQDYNFHVCSPARLISIVRNEGYVFGRHMLIINRYDVEKIRASVENAIRISKRPTYEESFLVLSRYFAWEFEDYGI